MAKIRMRKSIAVWLIVVFLLHSLALDAAVLANEADQDRITVAFTHDLHDHFLPLRIENDSGVSDVGGWARLAGAIALERQKDPDLLLVDAGDYSMGTMFQMLFRSSSPGLLLMGQMGYDAMTLGNHEFDFLPEGLAQHLENAVQSGVALPKMVASNMVFPEDRDDDLNRLKAAMDAYPVLPYTVIVKKDLRIGLFGIMGKEADSNAPMAGVLFTDQIEAAEKMVEFLRDEEQVDLVVCLSHSGTHPDEKRSEDDILAQEVAGIDLIISGHSHTRLDEPLFHGNTAIVSAGQYGEALGVVELIKDADLWAVSSYRLVSLNGEIPADPETKEQISFYADQIDREYVSSAGYKLAQILAYSKFSFTPFQRVGAEHREEPLGNLIADAYRYAAESAGDPNGDPVAVAVAPSGTIRGSFVRGPITTYDAFVVSSLGTGPDGQSGFPLLSVYLTGKELKAVCEVDASITPLMSTAQLYMSGIAFTFNPHRMPFNKVTQAALVLPDGSLEVIQDQKLYRVVVGLYSAQMLSVVGEKSFGLLSIVPKTKDGEPIVDYLDQIIYFDDGKEAKELKEWLALANYLQSFPKDQGVSAIPAVYRQPEGRKIVDDDASLGAILGNPNDLAVKVYGAVIAVFVLVAFLIYKLIQRRKKKRLAKERG